MASQLTANNKETTTSPGFFGPIRFGIRFLFLLAALLACLPMHGLWRIFRLPSPWPRIFLGSVARICGLVVSSVGNPVKTDVFYASNHLSWIDIPVVAGQTGCAFVSKDDAESVFLIGWLCKLNHTVFVSRTDKMSVANQVNTLREAVDEKQPITIFPEGTTTDGQSLLPFKPSLFAVVAPPPKPMLVQPILLDFGKAADDIAWIGDEGALENAWNVLRLKGTRKVKVHFLEPFDPAQFADRKAIAGESQKRISAALSASLGGIAIV